MKSVNFESQQIQVQKSVVRRLHAIFRSEVAGSPGWGVTILVIADLRFILMDECPPFPTQNASQSVKDTYDRWTKANDKARVYILASMSDILSKKHEIMVTACQIMDSLREMFGQSSIQIKQDAIKYVYNAHMKEGQSVRDHVIDMIVHFNVAEMNGVVFDEKSQMSFILKSLPKSFLQFPSNAEMNKINYNMTTFLKELHTFQSLKGQKEGEANVVHSRWKAKVAIKRKCFRCNVDGHWKRNCPKYLAKKKEKEETSFFKQLEEGEMTLKVEQETSFQLVQWEIAKESLELIHSDLCGLMNVKAGRGFEYFISFIDDYSRVVDEVGPSSRVDETNISSQSHPSKSLRMPQWSGIIVSQPNRYLGLTETQVVIPDDVWELVDLFEGMKPIGYKWIYTRKRDSTGKSIRILLSIATFYDYEIWKMDVKTAFLIDNLEESIFMSQPEGQDICYVVGIVSRYQSNPGLDHWTMVKIILKYLKRTRGYMLLYGAKDLILTGYTDSDFQTDKDSKKFTSGSMFTLNGGLVVWRSINQGYIVDSTMEAEYVVAYEAAKEAVFLRKFLHDLEVVPNMNLHITLYCDNNRVVANSKESRSHKRGKHIERKYQLIREIMQRGDVILTKIALEHNIVDLFTKTLTTKCSRVI
ncbi:gag/pol protein [Cucumis melo var. makuwa]|uniref:Gag/pol protein n=1 Tax=Cucumis melo var. makuwa TaxID=1194695 RepID=A0A5D3DDU7_CUCMM|nr:gag/pol protein [Cucumis melo var. makuwa]